MSLHQRVRAHARVLFVAAGFAGFAHAQVISHEEAVRLALERAPSLRAQSHAAESAHAAAESAGRLPDPELVLGMDNVPVEGRDAYSLSADFMTMRRVGFMQALPNGAKRAAQRSSARAQWDVAETSLVQTRLDVARATSQAWLSVASAYEAVHALEELVEQAQVQADGQRASLAAATVGTPDLLNAQAAVMRWKDRLLQAKQQLASSQAELARWLGEIPTQLGAGPSLIELPRPRQELLNSLHRHALVQALDRQIEAAQSEVQLAKADKRPDFSVELAYSKRGAAFDDMVSVQVRVGLPLFAAHRQDPTIRAKQAIVSELQATRAAELQMHEAETAAALAQWDAARERLDLLQNERLPLANQTEQSALASYRAGVGPLDRVLAVRTQEAELLVERAEIRRDLGQAWAFLRYLEEVAQ